MLVRRNGIGCLAGSLVLVSLLWIAPDRALAQSTRGDAGDAAVEAVELSQIDSSGDGEVAAPGPNMVFCQLYGLQQFGRLGDVVGLSIATTSWNIGGRDMIWFQNPDNRHPFIVSNLYRLKNDRFEQIGMSHVKHGFFALSDTQCGGTCTYEPGHSGGNWLGMGCTDTYSASLNATQSGLGPRYEINGWTGAWTYAGSHMSSSHSHNAIQHRLQVRDADLAPAQNPGAQYFVEGYYLTIDDQEPMDSAAWKPVTVSGSPGGTWSFSMSGAATAPTRNHAINAWSGARQTIIAQQIPVVRGVSPDGRCVLAAKATNLGGGMWHYEYALLNVDMHRKGKSFSIPIPSGATVTNVGFSAVLSHDEPYSNTPWSSAVDGASVTWTTNDNPLRWATLYNFRFDCDAEPGDVVATVGLYEPGNPTSISGITTGPMAASVPVADPQSEPNGTVKTRFVSVVIPETPSQTAAGAVTALRVKLTSLHHVNPPYTGGPAANFSSFEGQVRWVGPPTQYFESSSSSESFYASMLQCTPHYRDWSTVGVLHISGRGILPSSVYEIQNFAPTCQGIENVCQDVSDPLEVATGRWGDIVAPYNPPSTSIQPDFSDVASLVNKFRNTPGAPIKAQAVIAGDVPDLSQDVDFTQISACVDAFMGRPYPYAGPQTCP